MEANEIKSINVTIDFKDYLLSYEIPNKITTIGHIKYNMFDIPIIVNLKNFEKVYALGFKSTNPDIILCEYSQNESEKCIMEYNVHLLTISIEVVLKEQIKNLKYVEQLNLFENVKENNG